MPKNRIAPFSDGEKMQPAIRMTKQELEKLVIGKRIKEIVWRQLDSDNMAITDTSYLCISCIVFTDETAIAFAGSDQVNADEVEVEYLPSPDDCHG